MKQKNQIENIREQCRIMKQRMAGSSSMRFRWKNIFGELYQVRCHPAYAEEALKAQAVCARTYAVWQMQEYAYPEYEAHVDDSVSFQVYNQVESQESTDQAVQETKGQIMLYEGRPVKAYYFATSCGVTTDEAIWEDADPTKTPYIEGRRTGNGSLKKSLTEETVFERFIRKKPFGRSGDCRTMVPLELLSFSCTDYGQCTEMAAGTQ